MQKYNTYSVVRSKSAISISALCLVLGLGTSPALAVTASKPASAKVTRADNTAPLGYQKAPGDISTMLQAPLMPAVQFSKDRSLALVLDREGAPSIKAMAEPILRLAGHRINPRLYAPSEGRAVVYTGLTFKAVNTGQEVKVKVPQGARIFEVRLCPEAECALFALETPKGLELWRADAKTGQSHRLGTGYLNLTQGSAIMGLDKESVLVRWVAPNAGPAPKAPAFPDGPQIQEALGKKAVTRTNQDMLTSPYDEVLYDHYFTSQLAEVSLKTGASRPIGKPAIYDQISASPNGAYILVERIIHPYSYQVGSGSFPAELRILDRAGHEVHKIADRPLTEDLPQGFDAVEKGPRALSWRADAAATLSWVEALDDGDPAKDVAFRDQVVTLKAPFKDPAEVLVKLKSRFAGLVWGNDKVAFVTSRTWANRTEERRLIDPSHPGEGRVLSSRNYQDRYNDPGTILTIDGPNGRPVAQITSDGANVLVAGNGASKEGEFPTLGQLELSTGKVTLLWQSDRGHYEAVLAAPKGDASLLLTRREGANDAPNYFVRKGEVLKALTTYQDPAPIFAKIKKQLVTYQRKDGVQLSGMLYLPAGYDPKTSGRLPVLMWAYPTEFTDPKVAGQVIDTANRFVRPAGASHLFLATRGYAIFDGPSMPIIGAKGTDANDTYVQQLVDDAEAAVNAVVDLGVADKSRIAVGGHSYGAFMTANLLAHTRLFKAGIARSGAYNRTLTPFGFQAEPRTYWQVTDIYTKMSPFTYAHQIKDPILLIHGMADDNQGTFPVQSERFFAALKGNGAISRFVYLPHEAHGYRASESLNHTLWEMNRWLDLYLKP